MAVLAGRLGPPWEAAGPRAADRRPCLFGAAMVGFGLSTWFPLSVALLVIGGALDNISVVIRLTLEQMVVPDAIRGRVSAVHFVFIGMSNELGAAESGGAAALIGTVPAIVAGGAVAIMVAGIVATSMRALAKMPPLAELKPEEGQSEAASGKRFAAAARLQAVLADRAAVARHLAAVLGADLALRAADARVPLLLAGVERDVVPARLAAREVLGRVGRRLVLG